MFPMFDVDGNTSFIYRQKQGRTYSKQTHQEHMVLLMFFFKMDSQQSD